MKSARPAKGSLQERGQLTWSDLKPPSAASEQDAIQHVLRLIDTNQRRVESDFGTNHVPGFQSVGIVGAGVMGASIAAAAVSHGLRVVITDKQEDALATLPSRVAARLSSNGAPTGPSNDSAIGRLVRPIRRLADVGRCDLVVEAIFEDILAKRQLLAELERELADHSVLASNTSTIPIGKLAKVLDDPGRFCGCHFFVPLGQPPMLEIVGAEESRSRTIAAVTKFAAKINRLPLLVRDEPGFVSNRLIPPYMAEALQLLAEGVPVDTIEAAATDFGMTVGPLRLCDETGADTVLDCGWAMSGSDEDLIVYSPLLPKMVKQNRLGRKSGAGFFHYDRPATSPQPSAVEADPKDTASELQPDETRTAATQWATLKGSSLLSTEPAFAPQPPGRSDPAINELIAPLVESPRQHTKETIIARLFMPVLMEATRMLQRGSVRSPGEVDLAAVLGFGFPPSRGGLLYWADTLGAARIVEMARSLEYVGKRYKVPPMLLKMAREGGTFY